MSITAKSIYPSSPSFEIYTSQGKKQNAADSLPEDNFLNKVTQIFPQAIQESRLHEQSVTLAAQGKISGLELLENTTNAKLSLTQAQTLLKASLQTFKEIEQIPL